MTDPSGPSRPPPPSRVPYLRLGARLVRLTLSPGSLRPVSPGRALVLLFFIPFFLLVQIGHWIALLLDEVLFPGYRAVEIREPLFVVGMPRSGTSYLQRVLARDEGRFTTLRLWELLSAPSILERKVLRAIIRVDRRLGHPAARLLRGLQRIAFSFMDDVHPVDLNDPEEDYFFLLPAFACFLLVLPFPEHPAVWALTRFDEMPEEDRRDLMALYRSCVQRHLYLEGRDRRWLSKNPSFTPMIRSLADTFPDARFVVCVRNPSDAVPSLLSSLSDGAALFGWDPARPPHRDRFLGMMEHFAMHALRMERELPDERLVFLPLPRLHTSLDQVILEIYRRFGWAPEEGFRSYLSREAERSRMYRSGHGYTLRESGLGVTEIEERFSPLLDRFDLAAEDRK